ncbi:hypothetical protein DSCA_19620 [Desulfosarcina alkanivorans]|uniref:Uncharacterized protein n=1 Tax=Desulfosarcina alkanivorans TaxID=571177 RepID=A0A5K7YET2_9BACT|nr:hypothetical protein [Desulfosarcina alkanivorans]BBO68032.1 hypothetical protein DSCA_19620 [Desulfosarcina alkanivorans]
MTILGDRALSSITGHGFSAVSLSRENGQDIARVALDIQSDTWTEIDSLKMGHWDNGLGPGWDQNWVGVSMGSASAELALADFVFQACFVNIGDDQARELKGITVGFERVNGTLSGVFPSISLVSGVDPVSPREDIGPATYVFDGDPFLLHINADGDTPGVWFDFGAAERQQQ